MAMPPDPPDRKFFKYMTAATAKKVLEKSTLRWALPTQFNDPFDVQFDLRVEYDRERVIDRALQNIVDLYMGRRHIPRNGNTLAEGIRQLQVISPGLTEAELRDTFQKSINGALDTAEKKHAEKS